MVRPVEDFILALERSNFNRKSWQERERESASVDIMEQNEEAFRSEVELFARDAKLPSFRLMHRIFARWNELVLDPDATTLPNTLAIAAQIELDKLNADTAAEKAKKHA